MVNKEGILFTSVIATFAILYVAQLVIAGYVITMSAKNELKKIKH